MPEAADQRLAVRSCGALAIMSARYWTTVISHTRSQLHRWREDANTIPDPTLRSIALAKLAKEKANVYFAGTFATLAPRTQRATTTEVIVALQVIYDYLDGVTEQPVLNRLGDGLGLFRALSDVVDPSFTPSDGYYSRNGSDDGGYLSRLVATARGGLATLPATAAVADVATAAAVRCAGAQVRAHATIDLGTAQLEQWAVERAVVEGISWPMFLAGAASAVISMHALIAAAADPYTTQEQAARIDRFHSRSTCAMATILDGFADLDQDQLSPEKHLGYLHYFPDRDLLGTELRTIAREAVKQAPHVSHGAHHLMTLAGVVAYYVSALGQHDIYTKAILRPLQKELEPTITPSLVFMRTWRLAQNRSRHEPDPTSNHAPQVTGQPARAMSLLDGSPSRARLRDLAIVIDGNRRWARENGLSLAAGYEAGASALRARVHDARELGIKQLTVYSLSTENLSRDPREIATLTTILAARIASESNQLLNEGICVRFLGNHEPLPHELTEQMLRVQALTPDDPAMTLFLAINYGARAEILNAALRYKGGGEQAFQRLLYAPAMREPQLIIRTGGEQRLSNFLLWQAANSELQFRDELWPDFDRQALEQAIGEFQRRSRAPRVDGGRPTQRAYGSMYPARTVLCSRPTGHGD